MTCVGLLFLFVVSLFVFTLYYSDAFAAEVCFKDGKEGTCVEVSECPSAQREAERRIRPQICSIVGNDFMVCCLQNTTTESSDSAFISLTTASPTTHSPTTFRNSWNATTETTTKLNDRPDNPSHRCEPIPVNLREPRTGQKAWDKCLEYQDKLIFPCTNKFHNGLLERDDFCFPDIPLINGGERADRGEFRHMVMLGFEQEDKSMEWACGGTLLSDRFILTAAHCTYSRLYGPVSVAVLGSLYRSEIDPSRTYKIDKIFKHPNYRSPHMYNDIALLRTENVMKLNEEVVPACLDVGGELNYENVVATGWGLTSYGGKTSDVLQKVWLTKFNHSECSSSFRPHRLMQRGVDAETQVCYGDHEKERDTCQGDSGGPLQVFSLRILCMYTVIGVTAYGIGCGRVGTPGIYTRVAPYVPWIESVVWE